MLVLIIIGIIWFVCTFLIIRDYAFLMRLKVGHVIELYYLKYDSLDYYELAGSYKITAIKRNYIFCMSPSGVSITFDFFNLISKYDKILIADENGNQILERQKRKRHGRL